MSTRGVAVSDDLILDAAEDLFAVRGAAGTTVEDIAAAAGVSRITIYRRIGNRDQLLLSVLLRFTERFLRQLRPRLLAAADLTDALALLVRATVRGARQEELGVVFGAEQSRLTGAPIPGSLAPLSTLFGAVVAEVVEHLEGELGEGITSEEAGEWVLRMVLSFATIDVDPPRPAAEVDRWVRTFALPGLVRSP